MKTLCMCSALLAAVAGLANASTLTYLITAGQLESALVGNATLSGSGCNDSTAGNVLNNCGIYQLVLTANGNNYAETAVVPIQAAGAGFWSTNSVSSNPAMQDANDTPNGMINFISQNTGVNGVSYGTEFGSNAQTGLGVYGAGTDLGFTFSSSGSFAATDTFTLSLYGAIFQSATNGALSTGAQKTFVLNSVVVTAMAAPEPSSAILLFGAMACLALLARPRRSPR